MGCIRGMTLLEIRDLKVDYTRPDGGKISILNIPRFDLDASAQVCLRGRSGSGKTTLLNVIAGLLTPSRGKVTLDGVSLTALSEAQRDGVRGKKVGIVFQTFNLLPGFTALENVLLGSVFAGDPDEEAAETRKRALALLKQVGLEERIQHRPRMLSAGEQQRVAIARALINKPRLILADEPTGSLDQKSGEAALDLLLRLSADLGAALLLATHDPAVMARFWRVVELKELNLS